MDERVRNFVGVTGASEDAARQVIDMCGGDIEQAVMLWFADEELQRNLTASAVTLPSSSTAPNATRAGAHSRPNQLEATGRQDAQGVIHIDSDDDDQDIDMSDDEELADLDEQHDARAAASVARTAQEEEDALMAQRLQEEMYQNGPVDADGVRAPIQRRTEVLVAGHGMGDGAEDVYQALAAEQMRRQHQLLRARSNANNPFSQSIWEDPTAARNAGQASGPADRANHLAALFRPPYDLMSQLPFDEARDEGKANKRWLLVNLQDPSDFHCQALNRDVWHDAAMKQLVSQHFVFLQYERNHPSSEQYVSFYFTDQSHERAETYPHVSIIDPRTGEQVKTWSGTPFPTALDLHAQLVEFLDRYSLEANSKNPVVKAKRPEQKKDIGRMTEEEMLEMALQASLAPNAGESSSSSRSTAFDPDALTKSPRLSNSHNGEVTTAAAEDAASGSAFSSIPSDRAHEEPENNATETTRIQFRHPEGRIIRRFRLDDRVARLYEWLKAAPLEGKAGADFELKVMPQGRDLLEDLDLTIDEASLKQGTVMIEFV